MSLVSPDFPARQPRPGDVQQATYRAAEGQCFLPGLTPQDDKHGY